MLLALLLAVCLQQTRARWVPVQPETPQTSAVVLLVALVV
jgi:hypothetical protein